MKTFTFFILVCFLILSASVTQAYRVWILGPPPDYELVEVIPDLTKNRHHYVHWEATRRIPIYVNIDGAGDGLTWEDTHLEIMTGVNSWQGVSTSYMNFLDAGATSARVDANDRLNVCVWDLDVPNGVLAQARVTCDVATMEILDVDIEFNDDVIWAGQISAEYEEEEESREIRYVATHELGHLLGIAHTQHENTNIVMHPHYPHANGVLHQDDTTAITYLYPQSEIVSSGTSPLSQATLGNNQRKLLVDGGGQLHQVFASAAPPGTPSTGHIIYRSSSDGGSFWSTGRWINHLQGVVEYPCIAGRGSYLYLVWQRRNGSNWDVLYSYSTNGGANWLGVPIMLVNNFSCPEPGPQPVVLASVPSSSFELMVVYRQGSGLSSLRSTSYPLGGNWIGPVQVTGTNQYSRNPSLTYRSNAYPPFRLVWDESNKINYSLYYPNTWTTPIDVASGAYMATDKSHPSISLTSANDIDIVWEGTYNGTRSIITNRNLASVYSLFQNSSSHYYKPSVTGHLNGRATAVWHDNSLNVRKAFYDPAYGWYSIGSVIGTNGANPSASILNPQGGNARVMWTQGTSSPYTIYLDGTTLNRPVADGGERYDPIAESGMEIHRQLCS